MSQIKRIGSLDIDQDIQFQEREWKFERVGWVALLVVILLALSGLFGGGPLSQVTLKTADGFQTTYARIDREYKFNEMLFVLPPQAFQQGQAKFWISPRFLSHFQYVSMAPNPNNVDISGERMIFTIKVADPSQPVLVKLNIWTQANGLLQGQAGLVGGDSLSFSEFIYP